MNEVMIVWMLLFATRTAVEHPQLDIETCLKIGREQNLALQISTFTLEKSRLELERAWRDRYLPRLDLSLTAPSIRQYSAQQVDPETDELVLYPRESRTYTGGVSLEVPLPTDGSATIDYSSQRWEDFPRSDGEEYDPTYTSMLSFTLSQPLLDRSQGTHIALKQARLGFQVARASYDKAVYDLDYRIAVAFLAAVRAQEQAVIDSVELMVAEENANLGRRKFASGLLSKGDVLELELAEATTKAAYLSSAAAKKRAMEELLLVLGSPLDLAPHLVVPPPAPEPTISPQRAVTVALERRREVLSQELELSLAASRLWQTAQAEGPSLDLTLGLDLYRSGRTLRPAWSGPQRERALTVGFSMPLWDFGRARSEIHKAEISAEQEETDLQQTERDVIIEVRATVRDVETTIERKHLLQIALNVAEENYTVAVSRFESGSISSQRLLDAQLSLFRARTNLLSARVDLDLALRRLQKVTLARLDELVEPAD